MIYLAVKNLNTPHEATMAIKLSLSKALKLAEDDKTLSVVAKSKIGCWVLFEGTWKEIEK